MSNQVLSRCAATTALALLFTVGGASAAVAQPDPGDPSSTGVPTAGSNCELSRVGTHFVRCDALTGAGVAAPASVPELGSADDHPWPGCWTGN